MSKLTQGQKDELLEGIDHSIKILQSFLLQKNVLCKRYRVVTPDKPFKPKITCDGCPETKEVNGVRNICAEYDAFWRKRYDECGCCGSCKTAWARRYSLEWLKRVRHNVRRWKVV